MLHVRYLSYLELKKLLVRWRQEAKDCEQDAVEARLAERFNMALVHESYGKCYDLCADELEKLMAVD